MKVRKKIRFNMRPTIEPYVIKVTLAELKFAERLGISKEDYVRSLMELKRR
jgi:hypothetical protein